MVTPTTKQHGGTIDPRIADRRTQVEKSRWRRRWRWLLIVVLAGAVVTGAVFALHSPLFAVHSVTVAGEHPETPTAAIVTAAGLQDHPPLINVDPGQTASRVAALPFIASASVARHWPRSVTITVTERVPVVTMAGPETSWSTLDGLGRTLVVARQRPPNLPVLIVHSPTGPVAPEAVGHTLPPVADPGLVVARTLPAAFRAQVVSITVAADGTVSLALTVGITVLLGTPTDLHAKYVDVAAVIASHNLPGVKVIDVTVPQSTVVGR